MAKTRQASWETRAKVELEKRKRESARQAKTVSFADFVPGVIKDDAGQPLILGDIHRMWIEFIRGCWEDYKWAFILAPFGHGKSSLMAIALPLYELGQNTNLRIGVVCNTDTNAQQRVRGIARYIERDADYHRLYPHVKPAERESWTKKLIYIDRASAAVEPSVAAAGVLTSLTGRLDLLIADDIVDRRNALINPALRKTVYETFKETWCSRLSPAGRVVYICSPWHRQDATHLLLGDRALRPHIRALIQRVSDDLTRIENYVLD